MTEPGPWQDAAAGLPHPEHDRAQSPLPARAYPRGPQLAALDGGRGNRVLNLILVGLLALVAVGTLVYFADSLGANVFLICGALALIPLGICLFTLLWIDRWEPEPKSALLFAFSWGAGMSVAASLVVGQLVRPLLLAGSALSNPESVSALLQAPLVEEIFKGLGVLLIFLLRRRTFDGPINGVVYAGTVAAGFAFTENILYFGSAMTAQQDVGPGLIATFVIRGLMSPFAHVMFTATLGAILGYAARHGGTALALCAWTAGLIPAMLLHALWNSSSMISANFLVVYGALQLPIFILYVLGVVLLRLSEARLTRRRLSEYVPSGWFLSEEITMIGTGAGRRRAVAWARTFGAARTMKRFINLATRLAFTRQRILAGSRLSDSLQQESVLLERVTAAREELLSRQAGTARPEHS
ncbi:MAG: PrsW family intramembrane metalloprotease [Actinomycetota bacterium]|nr:PrsW family intramembrane metalloprotease [Actinomycetota bacterium]